VCCEPYLRLLAKRDTVDADIAPSLTHSVQVQWLRMLGPENLVQLALGYLAEVDHP
jgi:hypothetical protein